MTFSQALIKTESFTVLFTCRSRSSPCFVFEVTLSLVKFLIVSVFILKLYLLVSSLKSLSIESPHELVKGGRVHLKKDSGLFGM